MECKCEQCGGECVDCKCTVCGAMVDAKAESCECGNTEMDCKCEGCEQA